MTRHSLSGIRKAILLGVAALVLAMVSLGSMVWPVSQQTLAPHLKHALQRDTEYTLESLGATTFTALPWPTLEIADISLKKPTSPHERVSASQLKLRLNLASWLWGDPRIVEIKLTKPVIHLASSEKIGETEAVSTAILNFLRNDKRPDLRAFSVNNATILLDEKPWIDNLWLNVRNVAMTDLRLRGRANYRDTAVQVSADIGQGKSSEARSIRWQITLPGLSTSFAGVLFGSRSFDADGLFFAHSTDGQRYAKLLGLDDTVFGLFNPVSVQGETRFTWPHMQMKRALVGWRGQSLTGSLEMSLDKEKPQFSATLGAETLSVDPLASMLSSNVVSNASRWSQLPLPMAWMRSGAIDIRISSERLHFGGLALDNVAFATQMRDGRFDFMLSEAQLGKGTIKARLHLKAEGQEIVARGSTHFGDIDSGLLQESIGINRIKGVATGQFAFDATGSNMHQLVEAIEGRGTLLMRNGSLVGLDLERLLTRSDRSLPVEIPSTGGTRFQSLSTNFHLASGLLYLTAGQISTFGLKAPVSGTVDLNRRLFDLRMTLQPVVSLPRLNGAGLSITGPWANPTMRPELLPSPPKS